MHYCDVIQCVNVKINCKNDSAHMTHIYAVNTTAKYSHLQGKYEKKAWSFGTSVGYRFPVPTPASLPEIREETGLRSSQFSAKHRFEELLEGEICMYLIIFLRFEFMLRTLMS